MIIHQNRAQAYPPTRALSTVLLATASSSGIHSKATREKSGDHRRAGRPNVLKPYANYSGYMMAGANKSTVSTDAIPLIRRPSGGR